MHRLHSKEHNNAARDQIFQLLHSTKWHTGVCTSEKRTSVVSNLLKLLCLFLVFEKLTTISSHLGMNEHLERWNCKIVGLQRQIWWSAKWIGRNVSNRWHMLATCRRIVRQFPLHSTSFFCMSDPNPWCQPSPHWIDLNTPSMLYSNAYFTG